LLIPKKEGNLLSCGLCGFIKEQQEFFGGKEKMFNKGRLGKGIVEDINDFAIYENKCKKCGHGKAQIIDVGVLYSDEDNLILLKCGKCGFSERIGRKVA